MTEQVILQVEDDDASYFAFSEVFREVCPDIRLQRSRDGAEALKSIRSLVLDPAIDLRLLLLDVFLPMVNGWEVLDSIRADDSLKQLRVLMFTNVLLERDQKRCTALGVEYREKPSDLRALTTLIKEICARFEAVGSA